MDKDLGIIIQKHVDAVREMDDCLEYLSKLTAAQWRDADIITKRLVVLAKESRRTYKKFLIGVEGGSKLKQWIRYTLRR